MRVFLIVMVLIILFVNIVFESGALKLKSAQEELYGTELTRERSYFQWNSGKLSNYIRFKFNDLVYFFRRLPEGLKESFSSR